jgi:hypothetical protein
MFLSEKCFHLWSFKGGGGNFSSGLSSSPFMFVDRSNFNLGVIIEKSFVSISTKGGSNKSQYLGQQLI